ncbi:1096_t:CDS:2, partial [Gigaspora rosea]
RKIPNSSKNEPQSKKVKTSFDSSENNQKDSYEVECGATYKYNGGMLKITDMLSNVRPHNAPKQAKLCNITVKWLITDSLPP